MSSDCSERTSGMRTSSSASYPGLAHWPSDAAQHGIRFSQASLSHGHRTNQRRRRAFRCGACRSRTGTHDQTRGIEGSRDRVKTLRITDRALSRDELLELIHGVSELSLEGEAVARVKRARTVIEQVLASGDAV